MKNNNSETIEVRERSLARPVKVLEPLIKEDLRHASDAAKQAGMPYYIAAGEKMIEAKVQLTAMEWGNWLRHQFNISQQQAQTYIMLAQKTRKGQRFDTVSHARGDKRKHHEPAWTRDVHRALKGLDLKRMTARDLSIAKEEQTERELGLRLIDIGYKVLAVKMHPDKGGGADAMRRLNKVRTTLKGAL